MRFPCPDASDVPSHENRGKADDINGAWCCRYAGHVHRRL